MCINLQPLKTNKTLQVLEIYWGIHYSKVENTRFEVKKGYHEWGHQDLEEVFVATMDLLQENPWLEDVNLFHLNNVHKMAIKAQLNTNASIRSRITSQHNVSEKEVSQKLLGDPDFKFEKCQNVICLTNKSWLEFITRWTWMWLIRVSKFYLEQNRILKATRRKRGTHKRISKISLN